MKSFHLCVTGVNGIVYWRDLPFIRFGITAHGCYFQIMIDAGAVRQILDRQPATCHTAET